MRKLFFLGGIIALAVGYYYPSAGVITVLGLAMILTAISRDNNSTSDFDWRTKYRPG